MKKVREGQCEGGVQPCVPSGVQTCLADGHWGGNGLDDDCDGAVDEICLCGVDDDPNDEPTE